MRAVPMSINLVGASCILTQGIMAENSSGVNDANGSGSASSSQTPASFSSTSSTMNNNNNNNNIHKNGSNNGSNGHSTYYYNNRQRINAEYDDEQTYLDLFGERAKELFTQHIIPSTDAECRWDWRMGRCEPYCVCGFQFLWGDYHLGRSCQHHWTIARQKACETVKKKVEERAQIRNQPVVLTKQGATWIRRVCGTGDGSVMRGGGGDEIIDRGDGVDEYADNAKETESEDIAEEGDSK
ncbi:hypothetical protein ACHAXR_011548 [Thalassiosira sp. AJA248-18]